MLFSFSSGVVTCSSDHVTTYLKALCSIVDRTKLIDSIAPGQVGMNIGRDTFLFIMRRQGLRDCDPRLITTVQGLPLSPVPMPLSWLARHYQVYLAGKSMEHLRSDLPDSHNCPGPSVADR